MKLGPRRPSLVRMLFIGFCLALAIAGGVLLAQGHDRLVFVATKDLPRNHLILGGDVRESGPWNVMTDFTQPGDFNGRYLIAPIARDEPIDYRSTRGDAGLKAQSWSIAWLPLNGVPAADVAALDPGRLIEVCNLGQTGACGAISVEAIACGAAANAPCSVAVRLSAQRRKQFATMAVAGGTTKISILTHDDGTPYHPAPQKKPSRARH